jgi:hypothetical protein
MPRYMIELESSPEECARSLSKFSQRFQDFLPEIVWGCPMGRSRGWAIVEAENESEAKELVPEPMRCLVEITEVKTLTPELIEAIQNQEIERESLPSVADP